jgi:hypothetical protein
VSHSPAQTSPAGEIVTRESEEENLTGGGGVTGLPGALLVDKSTVAVIEVQGEGQGPFQEQLPASKVNWVGVTTME